MWEREGDCIMAQQKIRINQDSVIPFHNQVDYCIGTGRMGLALQKEYQEQLKLVQKEIGFQYIRGHGLFCDDMAIYQEREVDGESVTEYNFTYLDMVMDSYRDLGLKPFLELGFMPEKLAKGTQTVFYWKGNTTPPKSYEKWKQLIQAVLEHLIERYGREEALTYPIEVWNEPNLPGFWEHADMQEYFRLFAESFHAVKEVDERFRVGGPAVCGGSDEIWIQAFMEFCKENRLYPDFITRHHYTIDFPEYIGHYGYAELTEPEVGFANLHTTREIIDSFAEYRGLPIHITEFNTAYIPNCPLHDTNQNAAYIAHQLSRLGEDNESYSYWTFGDIFEEQGVPFTPFHGGFGLVANGCIPKPTFWTFAFYKRLKEAGSVCVHRDEHGVIVRTAEDGYQGIVWNHTTKRGIGQLELVYEFPCGEKQDNGQTQYCLITRRVDEHTCNPLKVWHDMGEPSGLSAEQKQLLQEASGPRIETKQLRAHNGILRVSILLEENAVVHLELKKVTKQQDAGYSYDRVMQYPYPNPITRLDYPDPDVIRVEDTYYMVSTTMHFMPGCEILRSYDLAHWEHAAYVYDRLDGTDSQRLIQGQNSYGKGMWAASLRWHKGTFYVCFVANDTGKTYLYRAEDIQGPWRKSNIEGFYHDCSLLFDEDDRVYIAYGNRDIYVTELQADLSAPLEGGLHRMVVSDEGNPSLGYEGTHFYKINGTYYLFFIHSLPDRWRRVEACYMADSLEGTFEGGDVLNDDLGYCNQGVAQGGIVDTPWGDWYAVLFQDRGAVGRIPVLVPVSWQEGRPVFGEDGMIGETFTVRSTKADYAYHPLVQSDDFRKGSLWSSREMLPEDRGQELEEFGCFGLKSCWQFNHEPDLECLSLDTEKGELCVETKTLCQEVTQAQNMLTQRMCYPGCTGEVTVDGKDLLEGDYAGICALQGCYGLIGLTRREGKLYLVMGSRVAQEESMQKPAPEKGVEWEAIPVEEESVRLRLTVDFTEMRDEARFYYWKDRQWKKLGITQKLYFKLDHFVGCRFGLFAYATKNVGGKAAFREFIYRQ